MPVRSFTARPRRRTKRRELGLAVLADEEVPAAAETVAAAARAAADEASPVHVHTEPPAVRFAGADAAPRYAGRGAAGAAAGSAAVRGPGAARPRATAVRRRQRRRGRRRGAGSRAAAAGGPAVRRRHERRRRMGRDGAPGGRAAGPRAAGPRAPPPPSPSSSESESDSDSDSDDEAPAAAAPPPAARASRPRPPPSPSSSSSGESDDEGPAAPPPARAPSPSPSSSWDSSDDDDDDDDAAVVATPVARGLGAAACPRMPRVGDFLAHRHNDDAPLEAEKVLGRVTRVQVRGQTADIRCAWFNCDEATGHLEVRRRSFGAPGWRFASVGEAAREAARAAEACDAAKALALEDVVCQVCGSGDDEAQLVLCDDCDAGAAHTYCLELGAVPDAWRCDACARPAAPKRRPAPKKKRARPAPADDDADLVCAPKRRPPVAADAARAKTMPRWPVVGDRLLQRHNDVDPLEAEHVRARVSDFQAPPPEGYESPSRPRRCSAWSRRCPRAAPRRRSATSTWRSRTASGSAARCASRRRRTR